MAVTFYIFQIFKPPSLVLDGTQTHNFLIFWQTPKPSCLGALQEVSCLPKVLIQGPVDRGCIGFQND